MMDLELVPIEGKKELTLDEKKKQKIRSKHIDPELLAQFSSEDELEIKQFLSELIILIDEIHHEMEQDELLEGHEDRLAALNEKRFALFQNLSNPIGRFVKLLRLAPVESSEEVELLVQELRRDELREHYKITAESGIDIAKNNPFLMQMEDNIEGEHRDLEMKCRSTPIEIQALVSHFSLEILVESLITARRMTSGEFWAGDHYDL
jgi:hypothetical protein